MKKKIILFIQLSGSIFLFYWVFNSIDIKIFLRIINIDSDKYFLLVSAFILHFLGLFLLVFRWKLFLTNEDKILFTNWELIKILFISRFFINFLIGFFTSDSYKAYIVYSKTKKLGNSMLSVLFDRFSGMLLIFAIAVITISFNFSLVPYKMSILIFSIFILMVLFVIALIINYNLRFLEKWCYRNKFLRKKIYGLVDYTNLIIMKPVLMFRVAFISLLFQVLLIFTTFLIFQLFTNNVDILDVMIAYPLINTFMILPFSINGLGQREAIYVFIYGLLGVASEIAFTVSLTLFTFMLLSSLTGGIFYIQKKYSEIRKINI